MPKTVDEWLNEVDYNFTGYEPSEDVLKYINFIQLAGGEDLENKTPLVHLKMCEAMFANSKNTAVLCHRGIGKTSIASEFLILYIAAFGEMPGLGKVNFMIYVGDSIENGVKSLRKNIEYRYNNSEFLKNLIPDLSMKYIDENGNEDTAQSAGRKFTDVRLEFKNIRGDHLVVRLFGAKTGIRGAKELGKRPNLAVIDDILSDEDARSDTIISTIEDTIHKAVKYALLPNKSKVIWLGTPFNAKDPLYKVVESGSWEVACYPVCEKFPCTKEEFKGSWEDRFSYDYIKSAYDEAIAIGKPESFYQELMLRIISSEDLLIPKEAIIFFDREKILKNKNKYNFYITTDLATSLKPKADFRVISIWAYSNNGTWLLVDGWCKVASIDDFIKELFNFIPIYQPLGVGIEISGQQQGFISWIRQEMINKNIFFNLLSSEGSNEEGIRPIKDKFTRLLLFSPLFKQRKVWIANEMKDTDWYNEFENERSKTTKLGIKSKHDDVLDTISMLGSFEAYKPSEAYTLNSDEEMFMPQNEQDITNTIF